MSKEYAKLRKEAQVKPIMKKNNQKTEPSEIPYYVIAESSQHPTIKTLKTPIQTDINSDGRNKINSKHEQNKHRIRTETESTFLYTLGKEDKERTRTTKQSRLTTKAYPDYKVSNENSVKGFGTYSATTNYEFQNTKYRRVLSTTMKPFQNVERMTTSIFNGPKNIFDLIDGRINRRIDEETTRDTTTESEVFRDGEEKFVADENRNKESVTDKSKNKTLSVDENNKVYKGPNEMSGIDANTTESSSKDRNKIVTLKEGGDNIMTTESVEEVTSDLAITDDFFTTLLYELYKTTLGSNSSDGNNVDSIFSDSGKEEESTDEISKAVTFKTVLNSTDCIDGVESKNIEHSSLNQTKESKTETSLLKQGEINATNISYNKNTIKETNIQNFDSNIKINLNKENTYRDDTDGDKNGINNEKETGNNNADDKDSVDIKADVNVTEIDGKNKIADQNKVDEKSKVEEKNKIEEKNKDKSKIDDNGKINNKIKIYDKNKTDDNKADEKNITREENKSDNKNRNDEKHIINGNKINHNIKVVAQNKIDKDTENFKNNEKVDEIKNNMTNILNSTYFLNENATEEATTSKEDPTSTSESQNDVTVVDLQSRVKVSNATLYPKGKIPEEIEAILNISKNKEMDYEYDYNEPSLPPSLPNLQ